MNPRLVNYLEIGLVHQGTGVEGVARSLALQLPVGQAAELPVDQGKKVIHGLPVARADLEEKLSYRWMIGCRLVGGHWIAPPWLSLTSKSRVSWSQCR
jgi:hypothetical protein